MAFLVKVGNVIINGRAVELSSEAGVNIEPLQSFDIKTTANGVPIVSTDLSQQLTQVTFQLANTEANAGILDFIEGNQTNIELEYTNTDTNKNTILNNGTYTKLPSLVDKDQYFGDIVILFPRVSAL
jgi:hypothetical protein